MTQLVQNTKQDVGHAIQVKNVSYSPIKIVLHYSKTNQAGRGRLLNLSLHISLFVLYLVPGSIYSRGRSVGSHCFFFHITGSPVTKFKQYMYQFSVQYATSEKRLRQQGVQDTFISYRCSVQCLGVRSESAVYCTDDRKKSSCLLNHIRQQLLSKNNVEVLTVTILSRVLMPCMSTFSGLLGNPYMLFVMQQSLATEIISCQIDTKHPFSGRAKVA